MDSSKLKARIAGLFADSAAGKPLAVNPPDSTGTSKAKGRRRSAARSRVDRPRAKRHAAIPAGRPPLVRRSSLMPMEARMLFDGAIGPTADALPDFNDAPLYDAEPFPRFNSDADSRTVLTRAQANALANTLTDPAPDDAPVVEAVTEPAAVVEPTDTQLAAFERIAENLTAESNPNTIIFIDSRVPDRATLIAAAPADARVVLIDQHFSGVAQMAAATRDMSGVESVHIISYGEPGRLYLGSSVLTAETISQPYAEMFVGIGQSLSRDADILVYGCDFGLDTDEGSAAQALATATGADVAASIDLTGSARLGGDWDLEHQIGAIETMSINPTDWTGILDPISISVTTPPTVTAPPGTTTNGGNFFGNIYGNAQTGVRIDPTTGTIVGATALWQNAGFVGTQAIDLLATVIDADADDYIQFSSPTNATATADDPTVIVGDSDGGNPDTDSRVQIRWQIFETGTTNPATGEFSFLITDIDGVNGPGTREAIAASINDPVSYTLGDTTDLVGSVQGNLLQADGTVPNTGGNESLNEDVWVRFNWVNSAEFTLTYILYANNGVTANAGFTHDGDGDLQFAGGGTTASIPKIDLDASGAGNDFAATFTEGGSAVSVADTDITITNTGGTVTGGTVVLTNREAGDSLSVGGLPVGITATVDNSNPNAITVTLAGNGSEADYQAAIQAISFSNSSEAPNATTRTIDVQVANALTQGNTATASITVVPVNDAPINSVPGAQSLTEEVAHQFSTAIGNAITVSDIDASGANLTTTLSVPSGTLTLGSVTGVTVTGNGGGTVTVTGPAGAINTALDGLTYNPATDVFGAVNLQVQTSDNGNTGSGGAQTDTDTVVMNIAGVNDFPTAVDDAETTDEDMPVTFDATSNDTDPDGDGLAVTAVDGNSLNIGIPVAVANGTVTLQADGQLTFDPTTNYNGTTGFGYTVSDGNGGTATATAVMTVTSVNDAPTAANNSATIVEDTTVNLPVLANDSDPDGDPLTVTLIDGAAAVIGIPVIVDDGSVTLLADGTLDFVPTPHFNGPTSFTYTIDDGNGGTDTTTVSIDVTAVNDAPIALDDSDSTTEDVPVTIEVRTNDGDVDNDPLTVSHINGTPISIGSPVAISNGTVSVDTSGLLTYTPALNYNGPASFNYTISDGVGESDTATVTLVVNPANDNPTVVADSDTTDEETAVAIDVMSNDSDPESDPLTLSAVNGTSITIGATVTVADGTVTLQPDSTLLFTPNTNYNGTTNFNYTVTDGNGGQATATVSVTVVPVNDVPVAVNDSATEVEDVPVNLNVVFNDSDIDGDALNVVQIDGVAAAVGIPVIVTDGSVTLLADGTLDFIPTPHFNGSTSFDYTISDGNGGSATATVDLDFTPVNDLPVVLNDSTTTFEDVPVTLEVRANDGDVDNDPLNVSHINGTPISIGSPVSVANGSVSLDAAGLLTFTPDANYNGNTSFDYTVSDGAGGSATASVSVTVDPVNDAPVAVNNSATTPEEVTVNIAALSNDSDIENDPLSITEIEGTAISVGSPVAVTDGTVSLLPDGTLDFTPAPDFNGNTTFDYTITDGNGTATATIDVTVNPVNDAPVAANDTDSTNEDAAVSFDVRANDGDVDNDPLIVTEINGQIIAIGAPVSVTNGSVSIDAAGILTFTPAANYNGSASFNYTVSDGNGGTDTATVDLTIIPVNDDPVANNDSDTTQEDIPLGLNLVGNDTDIDGDSLVVAAINGSPISIGSPVAVTNGMVALQPDGSVTFTPAANYNGPANFTYTVSDGNGGTDTATANITVTGVNDDPVAVNDSATTDEDTPVVNTPHGNDSDTDGDSLSTVAIDGTTLITGTPVAVANGSVTRQADGTLLFTPNTNFNGLTTFDYTVSDGNGGNDIATVDVTVVPVNDTPVAVNDSTTTPEDTTVNLDVRANDSDPDNDSLVVTTINGTAITVGSPIAVTNGSVNLLPDGTLDFTPATNYNGPASFDYTISDGNGGTASATASITIDPVNDDPVATDDSTATDEEIAVSLDLTANDSDLDGDSLIVAAINGTPITVGSPVTVTDGTVALQANGTVSFTPNSNFNGTATFDYTVSDGNGGTDIATATITVDPVNDAPVANNDTVSTNEDMAVIITPHGNDTDVDGDSLATIAVNGTALVTGTPLTVANGTVTLLADGTLSFDPTPDFNGLATFDYTVSDGNGGTDTATVEITVNPVNDAPVAADDTDTTDEDTPLNFDVRGNDTDTESNPLTVTNVNGSPLVTGVPVAITNGTVTREPDGTLTFTPAPDYNGPASFDYTVDDGNGGTDTATVNLTVNPVNDAPLASDDTDSTQEDTLVNLDLVVNDNDIDGDSLAITAVNGTPVTVGNPISVTNGSVTLLADGTVNFTPATNYNGPASFDYSITDGNGAADSATVNLTVTGVNDAPVAVNDADTTDEDTAVNLDLTSNDGDIDGDSLIVSEINGTAITVGSPVAVTNGTVSLQADGSITFTPASDYNGAVSFDYTVSDGNGGTDTATVDITVDPVNDAPVASDDTDTTDEDTPVNFDVRGNDTDTESNPLTVTNINGSPLATGVPVAVSNGTVTREPDGTLTFTPAPDYNGPASFDYTVDDGNGGTDTATVNITVNPTEDAPVAVNDTDGTTEDTPVNLDVLANDSDVDGDPITVIRVNGSALFTGTPVNVTNGTVTLQADGTLTFNPATNYTGPASFDYTISDGTGGQDTATVNLTIAAVNDDPVANDDSATTTEDIPVNIDLAGNDSDPDGNPLSVIAIDGTPISLGSPVATADGLAILLADGTVTFAPGPDFNGVTTFDYTVADGVGGTDTATATVTVNPANDAPVATNDTDTTAEDTSVNLDLVSNDNDIDGDALAVTEVNGTAISAGNPVTVVNGIVTLELDGSVTFAPTADYNGPATFDYTVSDGSGAADTATVDLTITPVNDDPIAVDDARTTPEDTAVVIPVAGNDTDIDGDSLTVTIVNGNSLVVGTPVGVTDGTVTLQADGNLLFTPAPDFTGTTNFDYTIDDGNGMVAPITPPRLLQSTRLMTHRSPITTPRAPTKIPLSSLHRTAMTPMSTATASRRLPLTAPPWLPAHR